MNLLTVILYLIIVLVILLAIKYFYCNEEFTEVNNIKKNITNIGDGEKFKLTTVVGGKKYYMIVSHMDNCTIYEDDTACNKFNNKPSNKQKLDCNLDHSGHTLSLISEDDYKKLLEEQEINAEKEKASCEVKYKIECEYENKKAHQEVKQESNCEIPENYCKMEKYDPGLFTLVKNNDGNKRLLGFILNNKRIIPYAVNINKFPGNHKTMCVNADYDLKVQDEFTNVSFEEIVDVEPAYYLKMIIPNYFPCNSKNKYFVMNNSAKTVDYYFGISQKDNNQNYILKCDKNPRIEVYRNPPNLDEGDKKHLWLKFNIE